MPHLYYSILAMLSEAPDRRLRMTDLAEILKITRSRLTYGVTRLANDGLVRREGCHSDKRTQVAVLTDEGMAVLERAAPGHAEQVMTAVFDRLTPEQVGQLEEICGAITRGIQGRIPGPAGKICRGDGVLRESATAFLVVGNGVRRDPYDSTLSEPYDTESSKVVA